VPEIFLEGKWDRSGGLGAVPPVGSRGKALVSGSGGQSSPEADDDLLIQQPNFCSHSNVYAEIQL